MANIQERRLQSSGQSHNRVRQIATNADALVAQIRDSILDGDIKPGDFLGSERDISETYDVSRNTAREALRSLAALGAVEVKTGVKGGATVASGDVEAVGETLAIQYRLSDIPEDEVLEVQSVLEGLAAERAAEFATPEDIARLEDLLTEAAELVGDPTAFSNSSHEFHITVAEAAHSQALLMQLRSLRYVIWPPNNTKSRPKVAQYILKSHRDLLDMIKAQDAAGAHEFMRDHIEHIRNIHRKKTNKKASNDAGYC